MNDKVIAHTRFEIGQIDQLFQIYDALLRRTQLGQLDLIETTAVASVLHSFYNGLENIFLAIAKGSTRVYLLDRSGIAIYSIK